MHRLTCLGRFRSTIAKAGLLPWAIVIAATSGMHAADAEELFGGIELGAKGIKATAIAIDTAGPKPVLTVKELDKKTIDVTISRIKDLKFSDVKIEDAAEVIQGFATALHEELGVPEANIRIVASSGVPKALNQADLFTAVREKTGKTLQRIDAKQEGMLTALALVPKAQWARTLVVDVGSGNTKGGTFLDESGTTEKFVELNVPFGTTTFAKAIDDRIAKAEAPRPEVARELGKEVIAAPLRKAVEANPALGEREAVLFAGGSVWAFVTIMKPETGSNAFPEITADDIKAYSERLSATPGMYPEVDFAQVQDAAARAVAEKDYGRICGKAPGSSPIFKPDELQAGAALLEQVSEALDFAHRKVYFDRKAVTAWITAYITPEEYRPLLPEALGRTLPELPAAASRPAPAPAPAPVASETNPAPAPAPAPVPAPARSAARPVPAPLAAVAEAELVAPRGAVPVYASGQILATPQSVTFAPPVLAPASPFALMGAGAARMSSAAVRAPRRAAGPRVDEEAATAAYAAGYDHYWSGRYREACAAFTTAVERSAGDARFFYYKGLSECALGEAAAAEASILQGARLEKQHLPDSRSVGFALVRVQGTMRDYIQTVNKNVERTQPAPAVARSR